MSDIDLDSYLATDRTPTIDVRAPAEFLHGHIPGAINIPLFDDLERAEVGTVFHQVGRTPAIVRGRQIAEAKVDSFIRSVNSAKITKDCFVHCWRGGMRSEGFTALLTEYQFRPRRIVGGYKAFRQAAHRSFAERRRVVILGGASGSGKTRLLSALRQAGQQVIDLEGLANHRGSAFGGINQPAQPTVEQFENELFIRWRELDPNRLVWMEDESQAIGHAFIPTAVWEQMERAPAVVVEVDREQRVDFLIGEYGHMPGEELESAIRRLAKRLGGARVRAALDALQTGDLRAFTNIALDYYDKAYARSDSERPHPLVKVIKLERAGEIDSLSKLTQLAEQCF
jgi:tRNA 2-selenouridine synthase